MIVGDTTNMTIFGGTTDKTMENDSSNDGKGTSIVMTSNNKQKKISYWERAKATTKMQAFVFEKRTPKILTFHNMVALCRFRIFCR